MTENIVLKNNPKIEFQLLDNGFQITDGQTKRNTGFYSYQDLQSVELDKVWFPRLAQFLRVFTWILNGVPYFPSAESYKKAKVVIHFKNTKLGIWLTSADMASKARRIKKRLEERTSAVN